MSNNEQKPKMESTRLSPSPMNSRIFLFIETMIVFLANLTIVFGIQSLIPIDTETASNLELTLFYYVVPLIGAIIGAIAGLVAIKLIFKEYEKYPNKENLTPLKELLSTFKIKRANIKYQILYCILILFLVFIPLDFIAYAIPGVMDFSLGSLVGSSSQKFLSESVFGIFFSSALLVYFCVGFREELFFRGVFITRGRRHIGNYSSIMLFAFAFGLSHLAYIFTSDNIARDWLPATIWGTTAFIIGLVSGLFFVKKRYIWPLIVAHMLNNVVSSTALWLYSTKSLPFVEIAKIIYFPALIIGVVLVIIFRVHVKNALKQFGEIFKKYFEESGDQKWLLLFVDLILGLVIFFLGLFLF